MSLIKEIMDDPNVGTWAEVVVMMVVVTAIFCIIGNVPVNYQTLPIIVLLFILSFPVVGVLAGAVVVILEEWRTVVVAASMMVIMGVWWWLR